jgi:ligand-binding sensor protein
MWYEWERVWICHPGLAGQAIAIVVAGEHEIVVVHGPKANCEFF